MCNFFFAMIFQPQLPSTMFSSSSSASSQDGSENDQYQSLIVGDESPDDMHPSMAQEIATMTEVDQARSQLSKFSSELISVTTRLSELSAEKLQVEFENREMKSKLVPVQIAKKSLEEENAFLKSQLKDFWAEIEKLSNDKNSLFKDKCDSVRKLTDELSFIKGEFDALKTKADTWESECEKSKHQVLALRSEVRGNEEKYGIESTALNSRISQQESLISNLESQLNIENSNKIQTGSIENRLVQLSQDLAESKQSIADRDSRISALESEKENLLTQLVGVKAKDTKTKKQFSIVSDILGRTSWNLSDIVDELTSLRKDVVSKRKEIDQLTTVIDEMRAKMPMIEDGFIKLQTCEDENERLRNLNESLTSSFSKMADEIDSLKFARVRMETESQSLKIRNSEMTKQVAGLIHENEVFRSKQGTHAGLGRSTPALMPPALPGVDDDSSAAKRRKSSFGTSVLAVPSSSVVPHFRTVHDLVEQNSQLKDRVDNLLSECETEAQLELTKIRTQYSTIETMNSELVEKRAEDRKEFDRVVERLEKDLVKHQAENTKLKALIQYTGGNVEMIDEEVAKELVPVLQNQIQVTRDELNKHIGLLKSELGELKKVYSVTVSDLDKAHFEASKVMEEKNFISSQLEILKRQSLDVFDRNRELGSKLNLCESAKDIAEMKVNDLSTKLMLNEQSRRELQMKVGGYESTIAAMESAYKDLVSEKQSQSALLVGYHDRLQRETELYQTNAETLKNLYTKESDKYNERLNFYQSAYEEQVKRSNELSALLGRVETDLVAIRAEKNGLVKQNEEAKIRVRLSEVSNVSLQSPSSLTRDIARLETQVKSTEEDLAKYKELAKVNEQLVVEREQQLSEAEAVVGQLTLQVGELNRVLEEMKNSQSDQMEIEPQTVTVVDTVEIERLTDQVSNLNHTISLLEKRVEDEQEQKNEVERKVGELSETIKNLQETIHSERLIISAKESRVSAENVSAQSRAEILEKERDQFQQKIALLKAENEQYLSYFASDLSADEKAERGSQVIEQLKVSIQTTASKESQLLMDLQRARNTVEMLTRESMGLRSLVAEREAMITDLTNLKLEHERELGKVNEVKLAKEHAEHEIGGLKERVAMLETAKTELASVRDKLTVSESNFGRIKLELEIVSKQAQDSKTMHEQLVAKMAAVGTSEAAEQRLSQENAQLEKAKSQLSQTVSKLREEAREKIGELASANERVGKIESELKQVASQLQVKDKEIVRQDGLMKLKDKRIAELETLVETTPTTESVLPTEVMDLLDEYQSVVARLASSRKEARESVYHDASDNRDENMD